MIESARSRNFSISHPLRGLDIHWTHLNISQQMTAAQFTSSPLHHLASLTEPRNQCLCGPCAKQTPQISNSNAKVQECRADSEERSLQQSAVLDINTEPFLWVFHHLLLPSKVLERHRKSHNDIQRLYWHACGRYPDGSCVHMCGTSTQCVTQKVHA